MYFPATILRRYNKLEKPRCMLTVNVDAMSNQNIPYEAGVIEDEISKMMDIADKYHIKISFFMDFSACEKYGDELIEAGKYILSRHHDLQVYCCHYDSNNPSSDYANSIIHYVTEQYIKCAGKSPVAFRNGKYDFNVSFLKALKENGYQADLSYNCSKLNWLPTNRQFLYENGLIELPISTLPIQKKPLDFNHPSFTPCNQNNYNEVIAEYRKFFEDFYNYYGDDAIADVLMHSWSLQCGTDIFDYFISSFKNEIEFITVAEAIQKIKLESIKIADFSSISCAESANAKKDLTETPTNAVPFLLPRTCPICGENTFETFNSSAPRRCSNCGSLERTRTIIKLFHENMQIDFSQSKILHVSPSKPERIFFKNINAKTTTVDIRPECKVDIVADICDMPEIASESFDIVFASSVLNHVYDDNKALKEIKRVLRPGGMAFLMVLDSNTLKTVIPDDPTTWYGKENYEKYNIGTFRYYGEVDFINLLQKYFPIARCYEKYDEITDSSCKWFFFKK